MELKNTWFGGLDRDTAKVKNQNNTLYDCRNFRILTDIGLSSGALENIKGNLLSIDPTLSSLDNIIDYYKIIGHCQVVDKTILFTTQSEDLDPASVEDSSGQVIGTNGQLWELTYDNSGLIPVPTVKLRYFGNLNFSTRNPIYRAIGRIENEYSEKVYWTDNYNVLRYANILNYNAVNGYLNIPDITFFELKSNVEFSVPILYGITSGGAHKVGIVRYAYQLYNRFYGETLFSPLSNNIHLTDESDDYNTTEKYEGNDIGVDVHKTLTLRIDDIDSNYNFIKVYRFFYDAIDSSPIIHLIADQGVQPTTYITDTGTNDLGVLTEQEYLMLLQQNFICKGLDEQKNILFPANIREKFFDVDYDARAYRFRPNSNEKHKFIDHYPAEAMGDYDSEEVTDILYYFPNEDDNYSNINYANNIIDDNVLNAGRRFYYQYNSYELGGSGPNVSYRFAYKRFRIHTNSSDPQDNYVDFDGSPNTINGISQPNFSYKNTGSPYLSGQYRFYQRDEVYRFGIVFKSKKGLSSFVKWIGDIRMPARVNSDTWSATPHEVGERLLLDNPYAHSDGTDLYSYHNINANGLYLKFNIKLSPEILATCDSFDIVRVKRTRDDRHILCQGLLQPVIGAHGHNYRGRVVVPNIELMGPNWVYPYIGFVRGRYLITPEVQYNKNIFGLKGDYLQPIARITEIVSNVWGAGSHYWDDYGDSPSFNYASSYQKIRGTVHSVPFWTTYGSSGIHGSDYYYGYRPVEINKAVICEGNDSVLLNERFYNHAIEYKDNGAIRVVAKGTPVLYIDGDHDSFVKIFDIPWNPNPYDCMLYGLCNPGMTPGMGSVTYQDRCHTVFNFKRPLNIYFDTWDTIGRSIQYYGEDYKSRCQNTYISCGVNQKIIPTQDTYTDVECFGGDTFICMYDNFNLTRNIGVNNDYIYMFNTVMFPVETSINLPLTHGLTLGRTTNVAPTQEFKGIYQYPPAYGSVVYTQDKDMFLYNSVYSKERDTEVFLPKPADFLPSQNMPYKTKFSLIKVDGEFTDNWTNFLINNYNDADGKYEEITDIINFKDKLLCVQPKGIGIWSVLDRSLIQDKSGLELSLGSGGILPRIDYPVTTKGSKHQSSILSTDMGLYFFDIYNREWNRLSFNEQGILSLTDIKKMSAYLRDNLHPRLYYEDNAINKDTRGFAVGWNRKFNEIYFSCKQELISELSGKEDYTIVYNELLNTFRGFWDIYACKYINTENKFLSVPAYPPVFPPIPPSTLPKGRNQLWLHDEGVRGSFYDILYPSVIKFITTAQGNVGTFTNMMYLSEVYDVGGSDQQETFNEIHCTNDYQNSGVKSLDKVDALGIGNIRRRMRHWSIELPRDNETDSPRLRDAYMMTELSYDNSGDKRIVVHDITTGFFPANR